MATWQDVDVSLLHAWRTAPGGVTAIGDLARAADVTPELIQSRVEGLRAAGFQIDGPVGASAEYRLVAAPTGLIADDLRADLAADAVIGREIVVFEETDSTNDLAARVGREGAAEGLVIFAETQRAGRGTQGRRWVSAGHANLLFSVLLRPGTIAVERWAELTFCAALAVAETAERWTAQPARIKWPNDVLVRGRKVAGILLESHHGQPQGFVVVGVGLNVLQEEVDFPVELRLKAGSLASVQAPGTLIERRAVAVFLLERLGYHYGCWEDDFESIRAECLQRGCFPPATS